MCIEHANDEAVSRVIH